jgi:hypothetical protein
MFRFRDHFPDQFPGFTVETARQARWLRFEHPADALSDSRCGPLERDDLAVSALLIL